MQLKLKVMCGVLMLLLSAATNQSRVEGANAYPLFTDPNADGLAFGVTDVFSFGAKYSFNDDAQLNGNQIVSISQFGTAAGSTGAGLSVPISNGENGIDMSLDGGTNQDVNPDIPNATGPNSVFTTIGNPSGKLENGNVIRYSAWFRSDPANPITVASQVEPVLKIEIWKEALSGQTPEEADTNPNQLQPLYGDKVFDQDQHGGTIGIPNADQPQWIDINGNGSVIDGSAASEGRVSSISTGAWTLVETTYTIDESFWLGIGDDIYTVEDIEDVRAVLFVGDFANTNLSGDGNGGNLLVDNVLVEVFRNAGSVTPNTNPNPALSEGLDGDFNGDGNVDAADYVVWRKNGGTLEDYNAWRDNFGAMSPGGGNGALSTGAVPEPSSLVMVGLLVSLMLSGRARRS
ncbi:MAG: PEP-CTERM sorting domain-containing protein [Pirellulales bacterium]